MLINGKNYAQASGDEIITALINLPHGFTLTPEMEKANVVTSFTNKGTNSQYALSKQILYTSYPESLRLGQERLKQHEERSERRALYQTNGTLFKTYHDMIAHGHLDNIDDQLYDFLDDLYQDNFIRHGTWLNAPVMKNAHMVHQREVGYSSDAPMGTTNVHDCLMVAARDPITKRTALMHIDSETSRPSIAHVINDLLDQATHNQPIEMRLLGARTGASSFDEVGDLRIRSQSNLFDFLAITKNKNVSILSACIYDEHQLPFAVVDPQTFVMHYAYPPDQRIIGYSHVFRVPANFNLHTAFDCDKEDTYAPIYFPANTRQFLKNNFLDKSLIQNFDYFKSNNCFDGHALASTAYIEAIRHEHNMALFPLKAHLDQKIVTMAKDGIDVSTGYTESAYFILGEFSGLFIGPNAARYNEPIKTFIDNDYFIIKENRVKGLNHQGMEDVFDPPTPQSHLKQKHTQKTI